MQKYKRNQIEEAISRVLEPSSAKPSTELRTRLKRLLETDRNLNQERGRESNRTVFAFFSGESPGSGREIWFSEYEAFALLVGLLLMGHGWPQSFAVTVLRRVRVELEAEHSRTLSQDPHWLFDQDAIGRTAQAGDLSFNNQDPVLLTIVSKGVGASIDRDEPYACAVRRGVAEATKFARESQGKAGGAWTLFDVVGIAHNLSAALGRTKPRLRGRS